MDATKEIKDHKELLRKITRDIISQYEYPRVIVQKEDSAFNSIDNNLDVYLKDSILPLIESEFYVRQIRFNTDNGGIEFIITKEPVVISP